MTAPPMRSMLRMTIVAHLERVALAALERLDVGQRRAVGDVVARVDVDASVEHVRRRVGRVDRRNQRLRQIPPRRPASGTRSGRSPAAGPSPVRHTPQVAGSPAV